MLTLEIPEIELVDEAKLEFTTIKPQILQLEHSLISLSKWESLWCVPFLDNKKKSLAQTQDYIRCMTVTKGVDPFLYTVLPDQIIEQVNAYIDAPMTATTFTEREKASHAAEVITAELIFYWMVSFSIPFDCEKWHLNRLLTLIRVCSIKNSTPKKMSQSELAAENSRLNAERRRQLGTSG